MVNLDTLWYKYSFNHAPHLAPYQPRMETPQMRTTPETGTEFAQSVSQSVSPS